MQGESVRAKMESLRLACEAEISGEQRRIDAFASSFLDSLQSMKAKTRETVQNQGRLSKLKSSLKEAEDELVKALAVKTRIEAKRMAITDSISAVKSRQENLKRSLQDQKARRDKCAAIVSQELIVLECDPPLDGTKELIHELNKSNDLYKFVRIMRRKFQEFATQGTSPLKTTIHQEYSINSLSAPVTSVSTEISESPARKKYLETEYVEVERDIKKVNRGTSTRIATSSGSASSVSWSSRRLRNKD
ncbi:hypothetical protein BT93_K0264 [Corymbia citriodora subsp. variegata]|nr:hypothetical protein BT93_K0264 [Corymbia citriodora subsp. variegata]